MPEVLEAAMLILFSTGWYWSIARMVRLRASAGKSVMFVVFVSTGYALGVASKLAAWAEGDVLSPVTWVYAWNLGVTLCDLALVLHFAGRHSARPA
jgi:hypothetical protein